MSMPTDSPWKRKPGRLSRGRQAAEGEYSKGTQSAVLQEQNKVYKRAETQMPEEA
jgi:hypothetical protein